MGWKSIGMEVAMHFGEVGFDVSRAEASVQDNHSNHLNS